MDIKPVVVAHASPGPAVSTSSPFPHSNAAVKWESCTEEISYPGGVQEVQNEPDFKPQSAHSTGDIFDGDNDDRDSDSLYDDDDLEDAMNDLPVPREAQFPASRTAGPTVRPAAAPATKLTSRSQLPRSMQRSPASDLSGGRFITSKMRKMGSLEVKFNRCRNELQRIAADINIVQRDIPELVRLGRAKWLVDRLVTRGEEKEAVTTVLGKMTKRLESKKRRAERQHRHGAEEKRRPTNERASNQAQVKEEAGRKMTPVNIPKPTIVKTQAGNALKSHSASSRADKALVKNEVAEEKAHIKTEPRIKLEAD